MNKGNKRRRKKKITGRFYAFLSVLMVCIVFVSVYISTRGRTQAQITPTPTVTSEPEPSPAPSDQIETDLEIKSISELANADPTGPVPESERIDVTDLSVTEGLDPAWHNILLLGSDTRDISQNARTDTIMIASINMQNGRIKLTSMMRDMMLPIPGRNEDKLNAAAYFGGPKLTMKTINEAFGMNITEYVLVNFESMQEAIDILGGIYLDVTEEEMNELNGNIRAQARMIMAKEEWDPEKYNLKTYGTDTKLTGMQAVGYARIRNIGSGDYERTDRQRKVMEALFENVKGASISQMLRLVTKVSGYVDTNMSTSSMISLGTTVLQNGIKGIETNRLPVTGTFKDETRDNKSALYDVDLATNKAELHSYIYAE